MNTIKELKILYDNISEISKKDFFALFNKVDKIKIEYKGKVVIVDFYKYGELVYSMITDNKNNFYKVVEIDEVKKTAIRKLFKLFGNENMKKIVKKFDWFDNEKRGLYFSRTVNNEYIDFLVSMSKRNLKIMKRRCSIWSKK